MASSPGTEGTTSAPSPVADVPRRADGVELLGELSGSGYANAPSLVRRGDGQTLQVTPLLAALLAVVDGERDHAQLAEALSERIGKRASAEDVGYLLSDKIAPLGLLHDPDRAAPSPQKSNPLLALRFKVVAANPEVTRRLTSPFTWLFRSFVVVPVLLAFAAVCWWVLVEKGLASATRSAFYEPHLLLGVLGLTVLSAGVHEFGHAAACRYGGATPGAMGAGLYVVWPAFYTDVDDSYRLSRWGRLRVDLGGLYFNALIAVGVAVWWWVSREDALLLGVATQLLQMARQLAPYVRADGYHILADLTGVPDLFAHMGPTLSALLPWNWGKPAATPLRPWARVVVSAWVLLVVPMLLALLVAGVLLLPRLVATAWDSGGQQWASLTDAAGRGDVVVVLTEALSILALLLPIAAITSQRGRIDRSWGGAGWRRTEGRPVLRPLAIALVLALLAGLAWVWWPDGQYRPVQASERWTVPALVSEEVAFRPPPSVVRGQPRVALALVPRDRDAAKPAVLLIAGADGELRSVLTAGSESDEASAGRSFPFTLPDAPGEGDNQALAVGDEDGAVVYDVAVALAYVTDGDEVLNTNEAHALASCTDCTTVAVAFQVILVVGSSDVVAPTNAAVAANGGCLSCATAAIAVQLVVTLNAMPDEQVKAELAAVLAQLDGLEDVEGTLDLDAVYSRVKSVEAQLLDVLVGAGLVDEVRQTEQTATPTATPTPTPTPTSGSSPEPSTSPSASPRGSPSPTPRASTSPSAPRPSPSTSPASSSPSPESSPSS